jgi:uncharacterized membrane protein HdeD (DUF308 family)
MNNEKERKSNRARLIGKIALAIFGLVYFFAVAASFLVLKKYILFAISVCGGITLILDSLLESLKVIFTPKSIRIIRYVEAVFFVGVGLSYLIYFLR